MRRRIVNTTHRGSSTITDTTQQKRTHNSLHVDDQREGGSTSSSTASSSSSNSSSSSSWYRQVVLATHNWQYDPKQARAARKLEKLQHRLVLWQQEQQQQQKYDYDKEEDPKNITTPTTTTTTTKKKEDAAAVPSNSSSSQQQRESPSPTITIVKGVDTKTTTTPIPSEGEKAAAAETQPLKPPKKVRVPRGLYLFGTVGTGKTALLDAFFHSTFHDDDGEISESTTTCRRRPRRFHFYEFLQYIHDELHRLRKEQQAQEQQHVSNKEVEDEDVIPSRRGRSSTSNATTSNKEPKKQQHRNHSNNSSKRNNAVVQVAHRLADTCRVLCLDEFQILDVADAMLVSQVLQVLVEQRNIVLVLTSNRDIADWDCFHTPLQQIITKYCIRHDMDMSDVDYRQQQQPSSTSPASSLASGGGPLMHYYHCLEWDDDDDDMELVDRVLLRAYEYAGRVELPVAHGRTFPVDTYRDTRGSRSHQDDGNDVPLLLARVEFDDLCQRHHLGASDFRFLASQADAYLLTNIPRLDDSGDVGTEKGETHRVAKEQTHQRNALRRFITLLDEWYEARVPLMCTAATPEPSELFLASTAMAAASKDEDEADLLMPLFDMHGYNANALASVRDLPLAFRRTSSRLVEMTSKDWWNKHYLHRLGDSKKQQRQHGRTLPSKEEAY